MSATYEELKEENQYLRRQLSIDVDFSRTAREQQRLGIPPLGYKLLRTLYDGHGRVIRYEQLWEIVDCDALGTVLCRVRKVLGPNVIRTYHRAGLAITREGQEIIDNVRRELSTEQQAA